MSATVAGLISFIVGLIIGALSTVALFRSSLAVLQTQVSHLTTGVGELAGRYDRVERDVNNLADKLRQEMRALFQREGKNGDSR